MVYLGLPIKHGDFSPFIDDLPIKNGDFSWLC
jgi:hypothetical protein